MHTNSENFSKMYNISLLKKVSTFVLRTIIKYIWSLKLVTLKQKK